MAAADPTGLLGLLPEGVSVVAVLIAVTLFLRYLTASNNRVDALVKMQTERMQKQSEDCHMHQKESQKQFGESLTLLQNGWQRETDRTVAALEALTSEVRNQYSDEEKT